MVLSFKNVSQVVKLLVFPPKEKILFSAPYLCQEITYSSLSAQAYLLARHVINFYFHATSASMLHLLITVKVYHGKSFLGFENKGHSAGLESSVAE